VQLGRQPKVSGQVGRDAVALAEAVLKRIDEHAWNGTVDGPTGPRQMPLPVGQLFQRSAEQEVA
jgi:hypothetical protein